MMAGIMNRLTLNSHCDTCKILSGGAFTLNQIVPKSAIKLTKGPEPGKYTYYGDSGKSKSHCDIRFRSR